MVQKNYVAGLLTSKVTAPLKHFLDNISIAHFCPYDVNARFFKKKFKPQIAHYSGNNGIVVQPAVFFHVQGAYRHDLVTVYDFPPFVAYNGPVCIAVMCNSDICFILLYRLLNGLRMHGPAVCVYIDPVGFGMNRDHISAQLSEDKRGDLVGRTVTAVNNNLHALEGPAFWKC